MAHGRWEAEDRMEAVRRITAAGHGWSARHDMRRRHEAARRLQRTWRIIMVTRRVRKLEALVTQAMKNYRKQERAMVLLQTMWRRVLVSIQLRRKDAAARKIQTQFRRWQFRRTFVTIRRAVASGKQWLTLEPGSPAASLNLKQPPSEGRAYPATKWEEASIPPDYNLDELQRTVEQQLLHLAQAMREATTRCKIRISACGAWNLLLFGSSSLTAATQLSAAHRGQVARASLKRQQAAAAIITGHCRRLLVNRQVIREHMAAANIQAWFRMLPAAARGWKVRHRLRRQMRAAATLQSVWRMRHTQREMQAREAAAAVLQRWARRALVQRQQRRRVVITIAAQCAARRQAALRDVRARRAVAEEERQERWDVRVDVMALYKPLRVAPGGLFVVLPPAEECARKVQVAWRRKLAEFRRWRSVEMLARRVACAVEHCPAACNPTPRIRIALSGLHEAAPHRYTGVVPRR
eukprot:gene1649-2295_t